MKYIGSKDRIAFDILPIILKDKDNYKTYYEPLVGGANLIQHVSGITRIGADNNKYLISMWKALQTGWKPPKSISKTFYETYKKLLKGKKVEEDFKLIAYVGFCGSYKGKFYDGHAGRVVVKSGKVRDYPLEAYNNILKQLPKILDVKFVLSDYLTSEIAEPSIIYCDPPYKGVTQPRGFKGLDYEEFWQWCRDKHSEGHKIFISEYNAPKDFKVVWQKEIVNNLSGINKKKVKNIEKLFTLI